MHEPRKQALDGESAHGPPLPVGLSPDQIKAAVAERYGRVATSPQEKLGFPVGRQFAESVGYDPKALDRLPAGLWESFTGAGNPQPFVDPALGETLLDLGCGAGLDLALYAERIGPTGRLIGLDISAEMLAKAAANLATLGVLNVDWLHAPSDAIPLPDNSVDLVTANGIFNLSPDKDAVMKEIVRVLKPGGRTVFAEVVLVDELPTEVRRDVGDWFRCIGGALVQQAFLRRLEASGLRNPQVLWLGRNARTGHELSRCAVIRAVKA
jgi:SAM-dependent methyltransferase